LVPTLLWHQRDEIRKLSLSQYRHIVIMDLAEAIKRLVPLQILLPNPRKPLELDAHCVAEMFLVGTTHGGAVVWLEPGWCDKPDESAVQIAYAQPVHRGEADRWVDSDPRFGPRCIAYQKPVVIEGIDKDSPAWRDYRAWQVSRAMKGKECGRRAAWQRVEQELGDTLLQRLT
jgi:hypothetical protein